MLRQSVNESVDKESQKNNNVTRHSVLSRKKDSYKIEKLPHFLTQEKPDGNQNN